MSRVFTYWEGPRTPYIDLCLATMRHACGEDFCLVTPEDLDGYVPADTIHPNYRRLDKIAIRVCCIRAALLARYGGWWWDADTIGLRNPNEINEVDYPWATALYTTWCRRPRRVLNGYIYLTENVAQRWLDEVNRILRKEFSSIDWCSMGEGVLTPLMNRSPKMVELPRDRFLPIDVDRNPERFFQPGDPVELITSETVCYGMNQSYFWYHHRKLMDPPWDGDILLHRLLRHAEGELT